LPPWLPRRWLIVQPWDRILANDTVWELRVGEYRVFYDVDSDRSVVIVQAVRRKGRRTTGETL